MRCGRCIPTRVQHDVGLHTLQKKKRIIGVEGGRLGATNHKNEFRQAESHFLATIALLWPAGFSGSGLDQLKMTPDICGTACESSIRPQSI